MFFLEKSNTNSVAETQLLDQQPKRKADEWGKKENIKSAFEKWKKGKQPVTQIECLHCVSHCSVKHHDSTRTIASTSLPKRTC